jgi:arsenate reductase-like glutaredoxin family protein
MSVDSSTITETPQIVVAPTATTTQTTAQNSPARTTVSAATQRVLDIVRNELQAIAGTETETADQTQQQSQAVVSNALAEQLVAQTITTTPILVQQTSAQVTFNEALLAESTQKVTLTQELSVLPQNTPTSTADAPGNATVAVNKAAQDSTLASSVSISAIAKQPQGFELYSQSFKDSEFYEPKAIYPLQKVVDNDRARRLLNSANENRHQQMLQDQYK